MSRRSRTADKAARAERQRRRNDNAMIEHITKLESKKITQPESKPAAAPVNTAPVNNPYLRMLAKLDAANAAGKK